MFTAMNSKVLTIVTIAALSANAIACFNAEAASITSKENTVQQGDTVKVSLAKKRKKGMKKSGAMKNGDAMKKSDAMKK
jgi:outer membrane protein assembly factor BamE (lipoprotein component of BamABCDE complex)